MTSFDPYASEFARGSVGRRAEALRPSRAKDTPSREPLTVNWGAVLGLAFCAACWWAGLRAFGVL